MAETTFIRTKKDRDYSVIDNTFLRDNTLSAQAKGVFAYILFLPEDWTIYQSELVKHFSNGRDSISKIIGELEEHGYIVKTKAVGEKGRFAGYNYTIVEQPLLNDRNGFTVTDNPKSEIPTLPNTNNNQILNKTITNKPSAPFPEPEDVEVKKQKSSFSKSNYSECIRLISSCQNTLRTKGIQIDETRYPIPALNKWLKKWFAEYGVEQTKKGITNSITDNWLVNSAHYSLSALFSDSIFPKMVSNQKFNSTVNVNKSSEKHHQIDYQKSATEMPNEEF